MEVESVLITGTNRGIGLELVRQFILLPKPPKYVFATYRDKSTVGELEKIKESSGHTQVILIQMDITRIEDIEAAKETISETVKEKGLNLLVNNAGAYILQEFPNLTDENLIFHYRNNAIGPIKVLQVLFPLLQEAAAFKKEKGMSVFRAAALNISSVGGSINLVDENTPIKFITPMIGYRMSKSALNMAMRVISMQVKEEEILVVNMCPGWVRTRMGTEEGLLSVEESVSAMLGTFQKLNESHHGNFIDKDGITIPF